MASPARTLDALSDAIKGDVNRIPDPVHQSTLTVTYTPARVEVASTSGAGEDIALADPIYAGMEVSFECTSSADDVTISYGNGFNAAGNTEAVLSEAGDLLVLRSIQVGSSYRWRVIGNDGVGLS